MPDTLLGGIAINEFLADPNGAANFDTDGNGVARGGDEFVELVNTSAVAIDISGLELWDAGRDNWFTFPPGSVLQPGAFAVVVRNVQAGGSLPTVGPNDLAFDANFSSNVLNNGGDNIVVYDPANDEFIQATFNGDALDDPTATPPNTYFGFSATATRVGVGENFGNDQDGFSIQRTLTGFENGLTPTPGAANVCFASGTRIATPDGFVAIEDLRQGDLIMTRLSGAKPIKWLFSNHISRIQLMANPNLRPVVLPGAMPLRISRQHRVLVSGKIANRMFQKTEVLVPAKDLLGCCGVKTDQSLRDVRYYHILLDAHHIINANGYAVESLHLGAQSIRAMSPAALNELETIFSQRQSVAKPGSLCRPVVSGRQARGLAMRHSKNNRALVTPF